MGILVKKDIMIRSFFWRIFASFWAAIILTVSLLFLFGYLFNQDAWIIKHHPAVKDVAKEWVSIYESKGIEAAKALLEERHKKTRIDIQVLEAGVPLANTHRTKLSTSHNKIELRIEPPFPPPPSKLNPKRWRQITQQYTSPITDDNYLFIYRIPFAELAAWQRSSSWFPISTLIIAFIVLTVFSILLTLSITRPLSRLRQAVHDLGRTVYQKNTLTKLASRNDEFGTLAKDFNLMGEHLQALIGSQRQLLRDVSHELRSPLARMKITLALLERAGESQREALSDRLSLECDRLEALIGEILALSRLDSVPGNKTEILLQPILQKIKEDAKILTPNQEVILSMANEMTVYGWADRIERAIDNLIRNAIRFNDEQKPIEVSAWQDVNASHILVRDHGPGVSTEHLTQLSTPFFRAPGQSSQGYGLGLAISRRAIESHGGDIVFSNHPEGGFVVEITLPRSNTLSS